MNKVLNILDFGSEYPADQDEAIKKLTMFFYIWSWSLSENNPPAHPGMNVQNREQVIGRGNTVFSQNEI